MEQNGFGKRLRTFRDHAHDVERGKATLTQARLGELVGQRLGMASGSEYRGATIALWESGERKIGADDRALLLALVEVLHKNGGLQTLADANGLLEAGGFRALDPLEARSALTRLAENHREQAAPNTDPSGAANVLPKPPAFHWPPDIPNEPYYPLKGREGQLAQLLGLLEQPGGPPVVAVSGLGGLGKTALAAELARRLLERGGYEGLVGDSAKQELFQGGEIIRLAEATLDFDRLLDTLARQLDRWDLLTLSLDARRDEIARLLQQRRCLVLVDNLETAENANALVIQLRRLLGHSRAILTSRKQAPHDFVHTLSLAGLELEDALTFLQSDAAARQAQAILSASNEQLADIHTITGGAPLALKLVVAQTQALSLERVLSGLRQAEGDLYPFLYRQSWAQLGPVAQRVLIYMGRTVVTTVGWDELANVTLADSETELDKAILQLKAYSLLEVSRVDDQVRYGLHALTANFINGELPKLWGLPGPT